MWLYYKIRNTLIDAWYKFHCRCQRFLRGWSDGDVWNMDDWFIDTVEPMLKHLRDHGYAAPENLCSEDDTREPWEDTLTEMIKCLHLMKRENAQMALGIRKPMSHQDYERINQLVDENKNRFFELFSEYFFDLWD